MRTEREPRLPKKVWAVSIPVSAGITVVGLIGLFVVRYSDLKNWPWMYVAFFLTAVGALMTANLFLFKARDVDVTPPEDDPERSEHPGPRHRSETDSQ